MERIPRESIPWYPTVNTDVCTGDRACLDFCRNGVFEWDEVNEHPIVRNPYNCVLGCDACAQVCPSGAIAFPSQEDLRATLSRMRQELAVQR